MICFYRILAVPLSLRTSLHEQAQGPVVSSPCAVVLQLWSRLMLFCPAVYISADVRAIDSCSTGASELGAVLECVHVYALSLTCLCLHSSCKSVFLS